LPSCIYSGLYERALIINTKYTRAEQMLCDIIEIRKIRQKRPSDRIFIYSVKQYKDKWYKTEEIKKRRILRYDTKLYNRIDDLYSKVDDANAALSDGIKSKEGLKKFYDLNIEIEKKCNEIVDSDWKKIMTKEEEHSE
jgi:hypothetical protein